MDADLEQRQYHAPEDIEVFNHWGTAVGYHERCRRCGAVCGMDGPGTVSAWGPCNPRPVAGSEIQALRERAETAERERDEAIRFNNTYSVRAKKAERRVAALAASFEARALEALSARGYTRSGSLTRESVGLNGMAIAFETAAREVRALLAPESEDQRG